MWKPAAVAASLLLLLSACSSGSTGSTTTVPTGPKVVMLNQDDAYLSSVYEWCFSGIALHPIGKHLQSYGYDAQRTVKWRDEHPDVWAKGCMGYLLLHPEKQTESLLSSSIQRELADGYGPRIQQALTGLSDTERVWCAEHDPEVENAALTLQLLRIEDIEGKSLRVDASSIPDQDDVGLLSFYDYSYQDLWKTIEPEKWARACSAAFGAR